MFERLSRKTVAATGASLLAALGVSGVAIAQSGGANSEKPGVESTAPENSAKDPDSVQYTAPGDADAKTAGASKTAVSTSAKEAPTASEQPGTEAAPGSESPGSEVSNNDGPGGHADEPGNPNADHQFQGQE